jgi:hypothetical protein
VCAQPSGVGSQHIGVPGSGVGGPGSAAATALPADSSAAAMPATIIGFIFMCKILLGCAVFVKLKRKLFRRDRIPGQRTRRVDEQIRNGVKWSGFRDEIRPGVAVAGVVQELQRCAQMSGFVVVHAKDG